MINYKKVKKGDILRVIKDSPNHDAVSGELVRVVEVFVINKTRGYVTLEKQDGLLIRFHNEKGASLLEPTKWKGEFPESEKPNKLIIYNRDGTTTEVMPGKPWSPC